MNQPEWLSTFHFLQSQWPGIVALTQSHPNPQSYDLHRDWQHFTAADKHQFQSIDWYSKLRYFRKSRLAYLAYHDLFMPIDEHLNTMNKVSDLADLLIQKAHQAAAIDMKAKHGNVIACDGEPVELMIWALGKLGTRELNYSSDVDLVFLYNKEGVSDGKRSLDAANYFIRLGQKIIKLLDHFTQQGQVYRVDMRLRPFGSAGPLTCSVVALQQYLQYEGREWERFAWMRARLVSGQSFNADEVRAKITPFIYRKHLDYTVFSALAKIKLEIADHLNYVAEDLKQGAGGIRAVEFIVQSLQLVFAGRNPALQGYSINEQIHQLAQLGKLSTEDAASLKQAWLWLRKLENICQIVADQATHEIPNDPVVNQVMAQSFGQTNWSQMQKAIHKQRQQVASLFNQLFAEQDSKQPLTAKQQFQLQDLMRDIAGKRLPRKRKENIEQLLQNSLQITNQAVVLDFLSLIKKILTRPNYILMLLKESNVHQSVLSLMAKHPYYVDTLQKYPVLLEHLFEREIYVPCNNDSLTLNWQKQTQTPLGVEDWMEALRYFKLEHQFTLMLAWSERQVNRQQAVQQLTTLAEFILSEVVCYSHQEITEKFNSPFIASNQLIVVAYGSAAMNQMTVGSDLDLVFIVDSDDMSPDEHLFAQKWVRRIIHHLITPMYHGKLYELDMQLRPNGNSGALVTTKKEFVKYQTEQAWIWEHAAMIKSTALVANTQQAKWHQELRADVLQHQRDPNEVDMALLEMENKLSRGHHHKDEFKILAHVLKSSHQFPELTKFKQLSDIQLKLIELNLVDPQREFLLSSKKDPAS